MLNRNLLIFITILIPLTVFPQLEVPDGMVFIPGGEFEMGIDKEDLKYLEELGSDVPHMSEDHAYWWFADEIPRHKVEVAPFFIDIYEVTNRQYERFVNETGYCAQGDWQKYAQEERMDHPIVNVTWYDAKAYAIWAGKRLPTEVEWEYAAKGGLDVRWFPWDDDSIDETRANYGKDKTFWAGVVRLVFGTRIKTDPAGSFPPNGYGLYDIIGNVSEWCEDTYKPYPDGPTEPWIGTQYGPFKKDVTPTFKKVVRGGGWDTPNPVFVRITGRKGLEPDRSYPSRGFRCVKSITVEK